MPDISHLVIEVESQNVVKATGNLDAFSQKAAKAGKSTDDLANKMGALQLIAGRLPGPLKSIASGMMGIVSPSTAAVSAVIELADAFIKFSEVGIDAYREQEVHLARLGAVLEATGSTAWTSVNQLQNYADSLRNATGRSANEIMQMQSVILGFLQILLDAH